jgi:hypothetical protein
MAQQNSTAVSSNQSQQAQVANAPKPQSSPLVQALLLGANAVNHCLKDDHDWPDLGDILTRMSDYTTGDEADNDRRIICRVLLAEFRLVETFCPI